MRKPSTPQWHLDLVRLRRDRPDMTHAELASILGKSVSAVRHVVVNPKIKEMISEKLETSEIETKAKVMQNKIQATMEMTQHLLDELKDMANQSMEAVEGFANQLVVDFMADDNIDIKDRVTVAMRVRDQGIKIREIYAIPPPPGKMAPAVNVLTAVSPELMQEITGNIRRISGGARRTTEGA